MLRDLRDHPRRLLIRRLALPAAIALAAGCGGTDDDGPAASVGEVRPRSDARITIVHPADDEVVSGAVTVEVRIDGGTIVGPTGSPLAGDLGHVHLLLDAGVESQMLYGPTADLGVLEPGPHTLQAEFVATDHLPFANRPNTTIVFTVE